MVDVFIRDLDKDGAAGGEEVAGEQEAVAQVGQVRVQAELPGVAVGLDHFRFAGHVFVVIVGDVALADERLEVAAELDAVGRVHVDHLHLAAKAFVAQQRVHGHQGVAQHHPVRPVVLVLIGAEHLVRHGMLRVGEQLEHGELFVLAFAVALERFQDGAGGEAFMDEQGQGRHVEAQALGFPGPVEEGLGQGPQFCRGGLGFRNGFGGQDALEQGFAFFARRVLSVPFQGRGKRGVVAIALRRLFFAELRLGADVRAEQAFRFRMLVRLHLCRPGGGTSRLRFPSAHSQPSSQSRGENLIELS